MIILDQRRYLYLEDLSLLFLASIKVYRGKQQLMNLLETSIRQSGLLEFPHRLLDLLVALEVPKTFKVVLSTVRLLWATPVAGLCFSIYPYPNYPLL